MSDDENIGGNNGFDQLGAGLGQMFSGLFGGMAQGLGNAAQGLGGQSKFKLGLLHYPFLFLLIY